ncbi:effector-associated constant component EACC1 [Saccharopolyspora spinosa]|uniref:Uncharacterized protein n=1 Tax=Saccharopolyspora spinosa TaxID=60894 RepID=A0A2N3Y8C8_SACSN|nr:hypothetical protein [Saccharopolyspora spinosa]PKW19145.1 hypothetical protein A8926_7294 [Saccharopolyspora spinosa]
MWAKVSVDGDPGDFEQLFRLLRAELRGRVSLAQDQPADGAMGAGVELWIALPAATVVPALAGVLKVWLTHRRADVSATVTAPDGRRLKVDASRVADPEALLEKLGELLESAEVSDDADEAS